VLVNSMSSGVTAIAGGFDHSLAVKNGNVYAWGMNYDGELGDGTTTYHWTPELIDPSDLTDILAVASNEYSSYALSSDGSLWVWGYNYSGELGLGTSANYYLTPQHLLPPSGYVYTSIAAYNYSGHAVAMLAPVPEPATLALLAAAIGTLGLAWLTRRPGAGRRGRA